MQGTGLEVDSFSGAEVTGHIDAGPGHHTPWGMVHGGVYASAVESACSIGASTAVGEAGQFAVGLSNTTDFLRAHRETQLSIALAIVHGCVAQAFLCLLIAIAVYLAPTRPTNNWSHHVGALRNAGWMMVTLIFCQLIVGAVMRHWHAGLAIPTFPGPLVPAAMNLPVAIHFAHRVGAVLVAVATLTLLILVFLYAANYRELVRPALGILTLVSLQIALGAHIIWLARPPVTTTLHVVNGAGILGLSLLFALRATLLVEDKARSTPNLLRSRLTTV